MARSLPDIAYSLKLYVALIRAQFSSDSGWNKSIFAQTCTEDIPSMCWSDPHNHNFTEVRHPSFYFLCKTDHHLQDIDIYNNIDTVHSDIQDVCRRVMIAITKLIPAGDTPSIILVWIPADRGRISMLWQQHTCHIHSTWHFSTASDTWFNTLMAAYRFPGEWIKDGMVLEPNVTPETIEKLKDFVMGENHVLIAAYPKTGER